MPQDENVNFTNMSTSESALFPGSEATLRFYHGWGKKPTFCSIEDLMTQIVEVAYGS